MHKRTGTVWIVALLVLATISCDEAEPTAPEPALRVHPSDQWAGGRIVVVSSNGRIEPTAVLTAGADTLEALAVEHDSAVALLPESADGVVEIALHQEGDTYDAGLVEVYGLLREHVYPVRFHRGLLPWPEAVGAAVIGGYREADRAWGLAVLGLSTGAVKRYPELFDAETYYHPALGPIPSEVYLGDGTDHDVDVYTLGPQATFLRSLDLPCERFAARLSDDIWFAGWHHEMQTFRTDFESSTGGREYVESYVPVEDVHGLELIPHLDRGMVEANGAPWGPPIVELSTGRVVAYGDPEQIWGNIAVATCPGENTFYVAGFRDRPGSTELFAVDALTGDVLRTHSIAERVSPRQAHGAYWLDVVCDSRRHVLLVSAPDIEKLLIVDPATFEELGRVDLAGRLPDFYGPVFSTAMAIGQEEGIAYTLFTNARDDGTLAFLFRLPPY